MSICTPLITPSTAIAFAGGEARKEPIPVVCLLSAPYSGATLFSIVLDGHPMLSCHGETFPPERGWPTRCSCGEDTIDCETYRRTAGHMVNSAGDGWDYDLFAHLPRYSRSRLVNRLLERFWINPVGNALRNWTCAVHPGLGRLEADFLDAHFRHMRNCLREKGATFYVDGTKSYHRAELLARSGMVAMKLIYLSRDGRGFSNSFITNMELPKTKLVTAAREWVRYNKQANLLRSRFPKIPFLHVRYEDLCNDFRSAMSKVCDFIGVAYDDRLEHPTGNSYHILGNRMRRTFDGKIQLDTKWQQALTPLELERITEIMRKDMERLGYL